MVVNMRTLVVGAGALGGIVAARMAAAGSPVWLATRSAEAAQNLRAGGLRVTGVGGEVSVVVGEVATIADYVDGEPFDLILLATKAHDAIEVAPTLASLLTHDGTLLPIQNGGVPQILARMLGDRVLGGLSNLGATMASPGQYEQRNAGHLLIGEIGDTATGRAERIHRWLSQGIEVRVTRNMTGAIWSKLLLNCSVTTIGAVAGKTMREYIRLPEGRELFDRAYNEALSVALATGAQPERMLVEPVPPHSVGHSVPGDAYAAWLEQVESAYGDLKPSMLQDFERGRTTEIELINGYVVALGRQLHVPTPANAAIVATVQAITARQVEPKPGLLGSILSELDHSLA
jgi:2-dehydropantoate 2-reductase